MKIVWICHFSNSFVREKLNLSASMSLLERFVRKILNRPLIASSDFAQWISNGIQEFENIYEHELHVISPHYGMNDRIVSFENKGVHYYFFRPDDQSIIGKIKRKLSARKMMHIGNRKNIKRFIRKIKPDIIHMYGAENPYYSISGLDIDIKTHPFLVTLQTVMSDKEFKVNYPIDNKEYALRVNIENRVLKRASYIGSELEKYRSIIRNYVNSNAIFTHSFLFLSQEVHILNVHKQFDFVYFAGGINKAADLAVEAFALAAHKKPEITLNIVGDTPEPFTSNLKTRIKELNIEDKIAFSGKLATHEDVIRQIQLSKYALLPLKIDIISGTIREAMFCGLPVVTTITPGGTPTLNENRISVLLSEKEDVSSIGENMIRLIEEPGLAKQLKANALITVNEMWNNKRIMEKLLVAYQHIIRHHATGVPIPEVVTSIN